MRRKTLTFALGFLQVALISAQTWQIAQGNLIAILVIGFAISLTWSFNVSRVAFAGIWDRISYAGGAAIGAVIGVYFSQSFS